MVDDSKKQKTNKQTKNRKKNKTKQNRAEGANKNFIAKMNNEQVMMNIKMLCWMKIVWDIPWIELKVKVIE